MNSEKIGYNPEEEKDKDVEEQKTSRRDFLKKMAGVATAAVGASELATGCASSEEETKIQKERRGQTTHMLDLINKDTKKTLEELQEYNKKNKQRGKKE